MKSEGNEKKEHALGDKAVYLIGAVLGIVIVVIIILVRSSGSTPDDSVSGVLAETGVSETVVPQTEKEDTASMNKAETAVLEETESEKETVTEAAAPEPVEMLTVRFVKGVDYEKEYDEDGDLVSDRGYNTEDSDINGQYTYQYLTDANGNKVSGTELYRYWISYSRGAGVSEEIHHLLQSVDYELNGMSGGIYTEHTDFVYDDKNRLIEWQCCEAYDQVIVTIRTRTLAYEENEEHTIISTTYKVEVQGEIRYDETGTMVFDGNGRLLEWKTNSEDSYNQYTHMESNSTYEYDEEGRLIVISSYENKDGEKAESNTTYEYDGNGNLLAKKTNGEDELRCEYDEKGNRVRLKSYNHNTLWEYDEEGRLIDSTDYYNSGWVGAELEEIISEYQYDEQGRIQRYSIKSTTDSKAEENVMEYQYNERGQLTEAFLNGSMYVSMEYTDGGMPSKISSAFEVNSPYYVFRNYIEQELLLDVTPDNLKYAEAYYRYPYLDPETPRKTKGLPCDGEYSIEYWQY